MTLRLRTTKAISWAFASQASRLLATLIVTAVLAHLLTPDDFGLVAMVAVFSNLVILLNDMGLPAALIQRPGISEEHLSSSFWLNLAEGVLLAGIFAGLAPLIAAFYHKTGLIPIVLVISLNFPISSLGLIQAAIFAKEMDFRKIAIAEFVSVAISGTLAVILAYSGAGVWSLVFYSLSSSLCLSFLFWVLCPWKPSLRFDWKSQKELLGFGLNLMGFNFINYFNRNMDNMLIGRVLGAIALGYYDLAYRLLLFPLVNITTVIGRVMFPALSIIQGDKERVRNAYLRAIKYIALASFPLMGLLIVAAPQFIRVAFGSKWEPSIFLVQVLGVVGMFQSVSAPLGWIYQSKGKANWLLRWSIAAAIINVSAFIIGLHWGLRGVAVSYAIAMVILIVPAHAIPFRLIDMHFKPFLANIAPVALATVIMGGVAFAMRLLFERGIGASDILTLITTVGAGLLAYLSAIMLFDRRIFGETKELFTELRNSRKTKPETVA